MTVEPGLPTLQTEQPPHRRAEPAPRQQNDDDGWEEQRAAWGAFLSERRKRHEMRIRLRKLVGPTILEAAQRLGVVESTIRCMETRGGILVDRRHRPARVPEGEIHRLLATGPRKPTRPQAPADSEPVPIVEESPTG